jgi:hypothetical protein
VVLTPEVVDHAGRPQQPTRTARLPGKEDTPYGRYIKAADAYEAAKVKCQAAQQPFINRMANDEDLEPVLRADEQDDEALGKGDREGAMKYQDQALALQDPSCTVKEPTRPDDYTMPSGTSTPRPSRASRHRACRRASTPWRSSAARHSA